MTIPQGHLAAFFGPGLGLGLPLRGEGQQGHLKVVGLKAGLKATQGHPREFRAPNGPPEPRYALHKSRNICRILRESQP